MVCSGAISPATNPRLKARAFTLFGPYCFCRLGVPLKRLVFVPILSDFSCHPERKSRDLSVACFRYFDRLSMTNKHVIPTAVKNL